MFGLTLILAVRSDILRWRARKAAGSERDRLAAESEKYSRVGLIYGVPSLVLLAISALFTILGDGTLALASVVVAVAIASGKFVASSIASGTIGFYTSRFLHRREERAKATTLPSDPHQTNQSPG
jgi:hypothetical protein